MNLIKTEPDLMKTRPFWAPALGRTYEEILSHDSTSLETNWLEHAIEFDVYRSKSVRLRIMVNDLFTEILKVINIQSPPRSKEALKNVLINLWISRMVDAPVRYSRDRNRYVRHKRYGRLFFRYDRLIPIIDTLDTLGYLDQKDGRFFYDKDFGRQTRMWGTFQLWNKFGDIGLLETQSFFSKPPPEELIVLHKEVKRKSKKTNKIKKYQVRIGYTENKQTQRWRADLERFNNFINDQRMSVHLDGSVIVNNWFMARYLYPNIHNQNILIESITANNNSIIRHNNSFSKLYHTPIIIQPPPPYNSQLQSIPFYLINNTTMTQMKRSECLMDVGVREPGQRGTFLLGYIFDVCSSIADASTHAERKAILNEEYTLGSIGVQELIFTLNKEYLHRVFNRASFKRGGRAYGALHQSLPKHMRPFIFINGEPTVEIDYSAYHIRMLYHRKGIDYTVDPYDACGGADMRKTYKIVGLVAINAKDTQAAYKGIRDELKDNGIPIPNMDKPLVTLVNTFKEAHKPIGKYLFSDVGVELQNDDSHIMNSILINLLEKGVPALSVHDSVIVAEPYADVLRETMVREYEAFMKFKPRF